MKTHPTPEDWMSFLYGEDVPARHIELDVHLRDCAECRQQVQQYRGSMNALDTWSLPPARRRAGAHPAVQWAAAAVVLIGLGIGLGRTSSSAAPDLAQLKAELRTEMDAKLTAANEQFAQVLQQQQTEFAQAVHAAADTATEETEQLFEKYVKALEERRESDRASTFAALKQIDERRQTDVASLRQDVATLAVNADDSFSRTREQLLHLAAATQPMPDPNP